MAFKNLYFPIYKIDYKKQLLDNRWISIKNKILIRDSYKCCICDYDKNLHVHHTKYEKNKYAWEYSNYYLITLCNKCHELEHIDYGNNNYKRVIYWINYIDKKIIDKSKH